MSAQHTHFIEHRVIVRGRPAERWERRATGERLYFIEGIDGSTDGKLISVPERSTKLRAEIDAAIAKAGGAS